jgi:hypothetical protein
MKTRSRIRRVLRVWNESEKLVDGRDLKTLESSSSLLAR